LDTKELCIDAIDCLMSVLPGVEVANPRYSYILALRDSAQADVRRAIRLACTPKRKAKK